MAPKVHESLTHDEVFRAELMSLRITMSVFLHHALAEHPNPDGVCEEIQSAVAQIVAQTPLQLIEPPRQRAYRELVVERTAELVKQAREIQRTKAGKPN